MLIEKPWVLSGFDWGSDICIIMDSKQHTLALCKSEKEFVDEMCRVLPGTIVSVKALPTAETFYGNYILNKKYSNIAFEFKDDTGLTRIALFVETGSN